MRDVIVASLACLALGARADADPPAPSNDAGAPTEVRGETIVITGLRLPRPVKDVPPAVTVVDRAEIERSPHHLVDDLLRSLPSSGTFRRSSSAVADPTSQGLSLRGVGSSAVARALVLRDGVPVNDPYGGWVYWRAISPLDVERIEVQPSGASALFGDFALGGVLQMISRPIEDRRVEAVLSGGSLMTGQAAVRATDRYRDVGVAVDGEAFHSDGYTPIAPDQRGAVDHPAQSSHGTAGIRVEHERAGVTSHVTARWFRETLDAGTQFTTADVRTIAYSAGARIARDAGALAIEFFGADHLFEQDRARVAPDRSTAALASHQRTPSNNQGALATWTMRAGEHHSIVAGADARRVAGTATDMLTPAMIMPDTLVQRSAGGEQRFAGVFVEDAIRVTRSLDLAAAVRLDGWQNRDAALALMRGSGDREDKPLAGTSDVQIDPRLGVLGRISDELALRASVYRAFRAPTLNELYRPFQVGTVLTAANEQLRPETLWGAEAGPQIVVGGVVMRATGFYNRLDDAIGNITLPEPLPSGATRQRQNFGTARVAGLELDASWHPAPAWTLSVAHTFMDAVVTAAPDQPNLVGKRLAHDPHNRATGSITFDDPSIVSITAQLRYLGPTFEDDLNTLPIGAVVLCDARIARALGRHFTLFATGENLFDRRYLVGRAGVDTLGAPRTLELGVALATK